MEQNTIQLDKAILDHLSPEKRDIISNAAKVFDMSRSEIVDFFLLQKRDEALERLNIDIPDHIENLEEVIETFTETEEQDQRPVPIRESLRIILRYLYREQQYDRKLIGAL
jgi:uncharacterized radical SAM superfamily Fe-S cluster-containing enzyme